MTDSGAQTPADANDDVAAFLDALRSRDIRIGLEGDKLRVNAPKGALTEELKAQIGARRGASR